MIPSNIKTEILDLLSNCWFAFQMALILGLFIGTLGLFGIALLWLINKVVL